MRLVGSALKLFLVMPHIVTIEFHLKARTKSTRKFALNATYAYKRDGASFRSPVALVSGAIIYQPFSRKLFLAMGLVHAIYIARLLQYEPALTRGDLLLTSPYDLFQG